MKNENIRAIICGIAWVAASYYPANAFYGASVWQMLGVYLITLFTSVMDCIAFGIFMGFNTSLYAAWKVHKNTPRALLARNAGAVVIGVVSFLFGMICLIDNSRLIENLIVLGYGAFGNMAACAIYNRLNPNATPA